MSADEWLGSVIIPAGVAAVGALIVWLWCNAAPDDRRQDEHEAGSTEQAGLGRREDD
jgi:hypothetical protein